MEQIKKQCAQIPFFGANYPDATCINGYLWDLDSYEDGGLTSGGDYPCPFCNSDKYIQILIDDETVSNEEEGQNHIDDRFAYYTQ